MGLHEAALARSEPYFSPPVSLPAASVEPRRRDHLSLGAVQQREGASFDMTLPQSYYPPRNDLHNRSPTRDCDLVGDTLPTCHVERRQLRRRRTISTRSRRRRRPTAQPYSGTWPIPSTLAAGDYAVVVEVNKEFDTQRVAHRHHATSDPAAWRRTASTGTSASRRWCTACRSGSTTSEHRHGADRPDRRLQRLDGRRPTARCMPRDATISTTVPGSGEARLLEIDGPAAPAACTSSLENCSPARLRTRRRPTPRPTGRVVGRTPTSRPPSTSPRCARRRRRRPADRLRSPSSRGRVSAFVHVRNASAGGQPSTLRDPLPRRHDADGRRVRRRARPS